MPIDYNGLGKRVKKFRIKKNLTQEELAKQCGVGPSHISNIETANARVSLPKLVLLANVLEIGIDDLLCDSLAHSFVAYQNDVQDLFNDCSIKEYKFLVALINTAKHAYRKNLDTKD